MSELQIQLLGINLSTPKLSGTKPLTIRYTVSYQSVPTGKKYQSPSVLSFWSRYLLFSYFATESQDFHLQHGYHEDHTLQYKVSRRERNPENCQGPRRNQGTAIFLHWNPDSEQKCRSDHSGVGRWPRSREFQNHPRIYRFHKHTQQHLRGTTQHFPCR